MKNIIPTPLETIIYWPATFAEVLLRKNFGKNYLSVQSKKHLLIIFLVPIGDYFEPLISPISRGIIWFLIACSIRVVFELARVQVNRRKGLKVHSYSSGIPLDIWKLITKKPSIVRLILEPVLLALVGIAFIATEADIVLGYVLAGIALSLFWKELFYIQRTLTIKTAKEDATRKQEAITNGDLMTDYENDQINKAIPRVDEVTEGVMDGVKNIAWKG